MELNQTPRFSSSLTNTILIFFFFTVFLVLIFAQIRMIMNPQFFVLGFDSYLGVRLKPYVSNPAGVSLLKTSSSSLIR